MGLLILLLWALQLFFDFQKFNFRQKGVMLDFVAGVLEQFRANIPQILQLFMANITRICGSSGCWENFLYPFH